MKIEWESFDKYNERCKVFGGWIVTTLLHNQSSISSVFVPDPNHEWVDGWDRSDDQHKSFDPDEACGDCSEKGYHTCGGRM